MRDIQLVPTDSIATATPHPFITTPTNETDIALSPSGDLLAYQSDETGRDEVYVRPVPGPGPRVPVSVSGGTNPVWSRDGKALYFRSETRVMAASIVEQPSLAVTRRDSLFEANLVSDGTNLAVLPDGRFVVAIGGASFTASAYRIAVLSNWQSLFSRSSSPVAR